MASLIGSSAAGNCRESSFSSRALPDCDDTNADPAGIGFPQLIGAFSSGHRLRRGTLSRRSDSVAVVNPSAFAIPPDAIGRFGNRPVGNVAGPGTQAIAASLIKSVRIAGRNPACRPEAQWRIY